MAMTLSELAFMFTRVKDYTVPKILKAIAEDLGHNAAIRAAGKMGAYQKAVGPFSAWPALEDITVKEKGHNFPLINSGDMQGSLYHEVEEHHSGTQYEIALKSHMAYAEAQEYGTSDGHIPPRPFMGPALYEEAEQQADKIGAILATAIVNPGQNHNLTTSRAQGRALVGSVLAHRRQLLRG